MGLSVWQVLRCACVPVFTGLQVLRVCALVCVPVVSALCLWCALLRCGCRCVAGFALCGAVGVCRCCAVVCAYTLCCGAGVCFFQ